MKRPAEVVQPFSAVVIAITLAVLTWVVASTSALHAPGRLAALGVLAVVHAVLQWRFARFVAAGGSRLLVFFGAQAVLVVALGALTQSPLVTLTLSLPVMGEALATLPRVQAAGIALLVVAASTVHGYVVSGAGALRTHLLGGLGAAAFVAFYVEMFERQGRARQQAQDALRELDQAHQQLRAYAAQVEQLTLANERQRLARELHDTLAQGLAGLLLQLEAMEAHLSNGDAAKTAAILRQARERARAALAEARRAIDDLRTTTGPGSLAELIGEESRRFSQATGIPCEVAVDAAPAVSAELAEHVQRCVSEGLANCARHAGARHARVGARLENGAWVVEIADDGAGFDPEAQVGRAGHYGLLGLRERARLAGGTLEVHSAKGEGTRLRLVLPAGGAQ